MKNLLVAVFLMILAVSGFAQTQDGQISEDLKGRVIKRIHEDVSDSKRWEVKAYYPELRLAGDKFSDAFSNVAKKMVMKHIVEFKKSMSEMTAEDRKFLPKGVGYSLDIDYSIEMLNDEFVSVIFSRSEYTGGAHPNHWSFTLNYDLKNEKVIELPNLFEYDGYLTDISEESIKQITKQQGEYTDSEWINKGAGEDLNNYDSWNLTIRGLKFTFDPYQVAAYAAGSSQTLVRLSKFDYEKRSDLFSRVIRSNYIGGSPPNWCRNGLFSSYEVDFKLSRVKGKKNTRSYFYKDDNDCPDGENCRRKAYLIAGDEVITAKTWDDFTCVWYQPRKGSETVGWIKTADLLTRNATVKPRRMNWIGNWRFGRNNIKFARKKNLEGFLITGNAFWKGLGDNIHIGELDFSGRPQKNKLEAGTGNDRFDCRVKMERLGRYLIVSDNKNCGGMNVTFDGVYMKQ